MKLLLDTHVIIWWLRDDPKLGSQARSLIADPRIEVLVSVVSFWEIAIKSRSGKLDLAASAVWKHALDEGFNCLDLSRDAIGSLENLAWNDGHKDPFDHILLAQAKAAEAIFMTADRQMAAYGVRCIGVS